MKLHFRSLLILGMFVLLAVPVSVLANEVRIDYGDAPSTYDNGSPALIGIDSGIKLGACVDGENSTQYSADALGDDSHDSTCSDDEDGIEFSRSDWSTPGATVVVTATVTNLSHYDDFLEAWVDFDGNGTFDSDEQIIESGPIYSGADQKLDFEYVVPIDAGSNGIYCYSRFRLDSDAHRGPTGGGSGPSEQGGEIEDYAYVCREPQAVSLISNSADTINTAPNSIIFAVATLLLPTLWLCLERTKARSRMIEIYK